MSTNGRRTYVVRRAPHFDALLAARSPYQPRLDRVIEAVEWSLGRDPRWQARHVAGQAWVVETPYDVAAPTLWVYYTIEGDVVTLRHFEIVRTWEG